MSWVRDLAFAACMILAIPLLVFAVTGELWQAPRDEPTVTAQGREQVVSSMAELPPERRSSISVAREPTSPPVVTPAPATSPATEKVSTLSRILAEFGGELQAEQAERVRAAFAAASLQREADIRRFEQLGALAGAHELGLIFENYDRALDSALWSELGPRWPGIAAWRGSLGRSPQKE